MSATGPSNASAEEVCVFVADGVLAELERVEDRVAVEERVRVAVRDIIPDSERVEQHDFELSAKET